jgi:hypothetical protein
LNPNGASALSRAKLPILTVYDDCRPKISENTCQPVLQLHYRHDVGAGAEKIKWSGINAIVDVGWLTKKLGEILK